MNKQKTKYSETMDQAKIQDSQIDGLEAMLDSRTASEMIASGLNRQSFILVSSELGYVRYKPGTNCIIGYQIRYKTKADEKENISYLYAKCYQAEEFINASEKIKGSSAYENSDSLIPIVLENINTIIYPVYYDKELKGIDLAFSPRKIARPLRKELTEYSESKWRLSDKKLTAEIIRYKPERRAVIKLCSRMKNKITGAKEPLTVFARCYSDNRAEKIGSLMKELSESESRRSAPVLIPSPITILSENNILLMRSIKGQPLSKYLNEADALIYIKKAGAGLGWLHSFKHDKLANYSNTDWLHEIKSTFQSLKQIMSVSQSEINKLESILLEKLSSIDDSNYGLMHGDYYADQILVDSIEKPIGIIDFDRASLGNQIIDLANFCADLRLQAVWDRKLDLTKLEKEFRQGYHENKSDCKIPDQFETIISAQMLKQVIAPFRKWGNNWVEKIQVGIKACLGVVE